MFPQTRVSSKTLIVEEGDDLAFAETGVGDDRLGHDVVAAERLHCVAVDGFLVDDNDVLKVETIAIDICFN